VYYRHVEFSRSATILLDSERLPDAVWLVLINHLNCFEITELKRIRNRVLYSRLQSTLKYKLLIHLKLRKYEINYLIVRVLKLKTLTKVYLIASNFIESITSDDAKSLFKSFFDSEPYAQSVFLQQRILTPYHGLEISSNFVIGTSQYRPDINRREYFECLRSGNQIILLISTRPSHLKRITYPEFFLN